MKKKPGPPAATLSPGALACMDCGQQVSPPLEPETFEASGMVQRGAGGIEFFDERPREVIMSQCAECRDRVAQAAELLARYPIIRRSLGSKSFALAVMNATLAAFDLLGIAPAEVTRVTASERDVLLAVEHLKVPGNLARWATRFLPVILPGSRADICAAARWSAVSEHDRQQVVDALAALLAARVDGPRPLRPPPDSDLPGCIQCGIGIAIAKDRNDLEVWGGIHTVNPGRVGGKNQPGRVRGYACPACAEAIESVGAVGRSAMEKALFKHLGIRPRLADTQLPDLKAFAALPLGTPANATPWAHVDDLGDLAERLRAA